MFNLVESKSRRSGVYIFLAFLVIVALWAIALASPATFLHRSLGWLYLAQVASFMAIYWTKVGGDLYQVFRPSFIALVYIGISISIGAMAFAGGHVLLNQYNFHAIYMNFIEIHELYFLVSGALAVVFFSSLLYQPRIRLAGLERVVPLGAAGPGVMGYLFVLLAATYALKPLLDPTGFLGFVVEVVGAVIPVGIFWLAFRARMRARWLIVIAIVGLLATVAYDDKRQAVFMLIPAIFLEFSYRGKINLSPASLAAMCVLGVSACYIIVAMSIVRGYGGYGVDNVFDALFYVPDYTLRSSEGLAMLANNFEFSYMFFVLHSSIYYSSVADAAPLMWGESYYKILFMGIPREVFGYKPESILENYTNYIDPMFRFIGGSYPPTAIGEAFWNFGFIGLGAIAVICLAFDRFYLFLVRTIGRGEMIRAVIALVVMQYVVVYFRGSGLDQFVAYVAMSIAVGVVILAPIHLASRRRAPNPARPLRRHQ